MTDLKMPVENKELIERVNKISLYEMSRTTLVTLFNKSKGNNITSILNATKFNEWFNAIQSGKQFAFVDNSGKVIPLSYSVESDSYFKFINFTAFDKFGSSSFTLLGMTISMELSTNNVYIDSKSAIAQ